MGGGQFMRLLKAFSLILQSHQRFVTLQDQPGLADCRGGRRGETACFLVHVLRIPFPAILQTVLEVFTVQQLSTDEEDQLPNSPAYHFQRQAVEPTDTLSHGRGLPVRRTNMIKSAFRGSDDATIFPFLVPSNAMAVVELEAISTLLKALDHQSTATQATNLASSIRAAIKAHGMTTRSVGGSSKPVYAYEVDGYGNSVFQDDANIPSLLSLPYLGFLSVNDTTYQDTRRAVLSNETNPWYFCGSAACGIGGVHLGVGRVWPMSILMQGFTASTDAERLQALNTVRDTTAGTNFIHESFDKNNAGAYSRPWFAWANSLYAEYVLFLVEKYPHLVLK
eukprot:m.169028 g.169028  ORF g.169028 m.169028 type:complete len:336 (+) comp25096_c0_seq2:619-1626(+)